jgi:hypothetical protein
MSTRSVRPSFVTEKQHSAVAIIIADVCLHITAPFEESVVWKKTPLEILFQVLIPT